MIQKIISGGEPGVEQAALDVAVKRDIECVGWIPARKKAESGSFARQYRLREIPNGNHSAATEENVREADGLLIISIGPPTGHFAVIRRFAEKYGRPWLHIDPDLIIAFQASTAIEAWIRKNDVSHLLVTGPKGDEYPGIYKTAADIIETALHLVTFHMYDPPGFSEPGDFDPIFGLPRNVTQAVDMIMARLSFSERSRLANTTPERVVRLFEFIETMIMDEFRLWEGNDELMASCREHSHKGEDSDPMETLILALREAVRKTDILKVVK